MLATLLSWVALLAIGAGLTLYYNPHLAKRWRPSTPAVQESKQPTKKKAKRTHLRPDGEEKGTSTPASSNEAPISKKRKIVSAPVEDTVKVTTTKGNKTTIPRDEDDDMSNREFAQQLAKAQAGTKLEKNAGPKERSRTVKQGKAFESPSPSAETSSNGGRDGDDDLSPAGSPPSGPVSTAPTSRAGDVSDMLEAPAAKPTTLRLTDVSEKKPKMPPKRESEQTLNKKQRQRQKANEDKQRQIAEAERERKALMEKQLKGARTAAGTSNQTRSTSFTPTQNAWKKETPAPQQPAQLLDTFDDTQTPKANGQAITTQPSSHITNGANVNAAKEKAGRDKVSALSASARERPELGRGASWADEVNDEEQARWEKDLVQEDKWESVTSKKLKKKTKKDTDTSSEASSSIARPKQNGTTKESQPESVNRYQSMGVPGNDWEA